MAVTKEQIYELLQRIHADLDGVQCSVNDMLGADEEFQKQREERQKDSEAVKTICDSDT